MICCSTEGLSPLKPVLARAWTTDLILCRRSPPFDWTAVSLPGGWTPVPQRHTNYCTFVIFLYFTLHSFRNSFLVAFWAVAELSILSFSYDSVCMYCASIWWAPVAYTFSELIVVIQFDYWRFSIYYATRTCFRSLSISQRPYGVLKEEIVIIMHISRFCNMSINSLFLVILWITTVKSQRRLVSFFRLWSGLSEMLNRGEWDYLPLIILHVQFSLSLYKVASTKLTETFFFQQLFHSWTPI